MAETIYRMLLPYGERIVLIGNGTGCWGSTDRPLGLLCRFLGRLDDAARHFNAKIALSASAGAHPWLARGQLDLAELLLEIASGAESNAPADTEVGEAQLIEATRTAREGIAAARRLDYAELRARSEQLEARLGVAGLPAQAVVTVGGIPPQVTPTTEYRPHVTVLGGFEAHTACGTTARWSSRKARELLCLLAASRGRAVPRERLMEYLWPGQSPVRLRNRLAVLVSTVRRTLDPDGRCDRGTFVAATRETVRLRLENVTVDAESFLAAAAAALAAAMQPHNDENGPARADATEPREIESRLSDVLCRYVGEAFADEPYADWAQPLREECAAMQIALLHALIARSSSELRRAEFARQILMTDEYDELANQVLVEALSDLGARGLAEAARHRFRSNLE